MNLGMFLAPHHTQIGEDLTSAYERDLDALRLLDKLGYDEAWIGEHHSGGAEPVPDPAMFIAHAANHTRHLRLGTGVVSLPLYRTGRLHLEPLVGQHLPLERVHDALDALRDGALGRSVVTSRAA